MTTDDRPDQLVAVLAPDGPRVLERDEPIVHADDLGLTRGDGCFDATLVRRSGAGSTPAGEADRLGATWTDRTGGFAVLNLERHLARLARSAAGLDLAGVPDAAAWTDLLDAALERWTGTGDTMLKFVVGRGREERPAGPVAYLTLTQLGPGTLDQRAGIGVAALSRGTASDTYVDVPWLLGGNKTIAYALNMAAQREARSRGADDALWTTTDGWCLEGPTSGLVVLRDGVLTTVPTGATGILASITVETLFEAAERDGLGTRHAMIRPADLFEADASWLVSSVRGVAPIRTLDGADVPADPEADARITALSGF
ncbi:aminotransferase class IV [Agilicoccus flavus]|uniref:aminotransferase class IV n=1 Tax=Agilicoccus flavus TaxID=2775968 RepID=UPI001CF696C5|nr:aminotransferase class IV [Agilicoccus flavus]